MPKQARKLAKLGTSVGVKALTAIALTTTALVGVSMVTRTGDAQSAPTKLKIGMYAPTVEFGTGQQRLQYVQGLAKAVESATGIDTEAQAFSSLGALKKAGLDFAIVDGQCFATISGWKLLANANVGGGTTRSWALYSSVGSDMQGLRGKKLAFVKTGCNDSGFIDNAMLESEVDDKFFSSRVDKADLASAVAEVSSNKGAQAVFAPSGSAKGLTKIFDTGSVPNPAFAQINGKLSKDISSKVADAVTGYGGGGAISSWSSGSKSPYSSLAGRMGKTTKKGIFAPPEPVRFEAKDVLVEPATLENAAATEVDQHFEKPPERME
jgi:hypothetical protein